MWNNIKAESWHIIKNIITQTKIYYTKNIMRENIIREKHNAMKYKAKLDIIDNATSLQLWLKIVDLDHKSWQSRKLKMGEVHSNVQKGQIFFKKLSMIINSVDFLGRVH